MTRDEQKLAGAIAKLDPARGFVQTEQPIPQNRHAVAIPKENIFAMGKRGCFCNQSRI